MASLKRKREEFEDSEDDEPFYGKQILPVANLPDDFDMPPTDGMEYLFTVRREMRSLPGVTRVVNPYEVVSCPPPPTEDFNPSHPALPSPEWRTIYKRRFRNFRENFNQPTIHVQYGPEGAGRKFMPDRKERDLWWAFLSGKPEAEWNPPKNPKAQKAKKKVRLTHEFEDDDETILVYDVPQIDVAAQEVVSIDSTIGQSHSAFEAREPRPSLVKRIDERTALHLVMYFVYWFNLYLDGSPCFYPTECHARWIFSLLARIEDRISGDDIALLRGLARACIAILKLLLERRSQLETLAVQENFICERSCWIIISTVVDIWEQRDLWMDAENVLKGVAS